MLLEYEHLRGMRPPVGNEDMDLFDYATYERRENEIVGELVTTDPRLYEYLEEVGEDDE